METKRFTLPNKIDSLQALRFLGAMCVTAYHFSGLTKACPFDFSNAVYLFYIISAFTVMHSTRSPEKQKRFLLRRLIRLLPLYWLLTVFTFTAAQFMPSLIGYTPTPEQLVKSLLFIPFRRVTARAGTALRPIVGLGHTLQMEMLFYLLFWLSMRVSRKYRGALAAGLCAAVLLTGVFFPTQQPVIHFYTANPYVWTSFIAGLAIYAVFTLLQKRRFPLGSGNLPAVLFVLAAVGLAVPVFIVKTSAWYGILLFAAVFSAGLVWSACGKKTPSLAVRLGNVSYAYYLLHYYTVALSVRLLDITSFSVKNLVAALLVSALTWVISWGTWKLFEQPLTAFLHARLIGDGNKTAKK